MTTDLEALRALEGASEQRLRALLPGTDQGFDLAACAAEEIEFLRAVRKAQASSIALLIAERNALRSSAERAREALGACIRLHEEALPKFNWGASALDANAIRLLNEAPPASATAHASLTAVLQKGNADE